VCHVTQCGSFEKYGGSIGSARVSENLERGTNVRVQVKKECTRVRSSRRTSTLPPSLSLSLCLCLCLSLPAWLRTPSLRLQEAEGSQCSWKLARKAIYGQDSSENPGIVPEPLDSRAFQRIAPAHQRGSQKMRPT
jgi:hypothetical protein